MNELNLHVLVISTKHHTSYDLYGTFKEAEDALYDFVSENWESSCQGVVPEDKEDAITEYFEQNFWNEWWEIAYCPFKVGERELKQLLSSCGSEIQSLSEEEIT